MHFPIHSNWPVLTSSNVMYEILCMANWCRASTFQKFYYKSQFNTSPGKAVLSMRK